MALKIGILNEKGGVAKTTTAICLTDAFTQIGYKTLLVDFDPQANSTSVFCARGREKTIYEGIMNKVPLKEIVVTGNDMGDIIPSEHRLKNASKELVNVRVGENRLKNAIATIEDDYEIIVFDTNPTAGIMMENVIAAVDGVIIPIEPEQFAIEGLASLVDDIIEAREELNPNLEIYGLLLTKYNQKMAKHNQIKEAFLQLDEDYIHKFKTIIRQSAAIPQVQSFMDIEKPENATEQKIVEAKGSIFKYGVNNNATEDYRSFAEELLGVIGNGE